MQKGTIIKRQNKERIVKNIEKLSDEQLETEYYKAVMNCLGSQTEQMYELGYDMRDIEEREKFEDYLCDLADIYEEACHKRGIELWKDEQK